MKKIILAFVISFQFFYANSFCQNFTYAKVIPKTVSFSGSITIKKDEGGNYSAPQWSSSNSTQSPVAYVSGTAPTVSATFTTTCSNIPSSVYIRGTSSDSTLFAQKNVTISGTTFTYPSTTGSKVFQQGVVRFFDPYTINWEISFDAGNTWRTIGSTSNTLYVTKSSQSSSSYNYHTVFHLSCKNANYQTSDTAIISHVWEEFTDQVILNYKGDSLYYYKDWSSPNVTLSSLLMYKDAECYTFAYLFIAMIKVQGIASTNNSVNIEADALYYCGYTLNGFLVKNWSFGTSQTSGCSDFPYKNTFNSLYNSTYNGYAFIKSEGTDVKGVAGQCNKNPPSCFNNHQVAKINGVYYDPAYGVKYGTSLSNIKNIALSGWSISSSGLWYMTNDVSKGDLVETITTY